ncbi:MAG: hypothetical protein A2X35_11385 [Elusimicrobia bacterium GWA2_61_42]|nr:MAG: hypothetical protein A2X35_11385 [Elusimicrobia bacterium GWA2_61_42]OGR75859.1 MAG: hypothetical protein A2X38_07530 [Elusimicrobia bacterium GWC2_61_25]
MKTNSIVGVIIVILVAAGAFGHARKTAEYRSPDLVAGYRGLILEMPGKQLAWIKKGDSLDVISVFEAKMKGDIREKVAATILQNVKVAGVDARKGTIVLLVNPNEAQYASLAPVQGSLALSLRARGDTKMAAIEIASYRKLIR